MTTTAESLLEQLDEINKNIADKQNRLSRAHGQLTAVEETLSQANEKLAAMKVDTKDPHRWLSKRMQRLEEVVAEIEEEANTLLKEIDDADNNAEAE